MHNHIPTQPRNTNTGASLHEHRVRALDGRRARLGVGAAATHDFLLVKLRHIRAAASLEQYVRDCADQVFARGPRALWCEVAVQGNRRRRRGAAFTARVAAHLPRRCVAIARNDDDEFLAVRAAFDQLGDQLDRIEDE